MTPSLAALIEKLEALKAGDGPRSTEIMPLIDAAFPMSEAEMQRAQLDINLWTALHGSLDAAVAFTEALLPGYRWMRDIVGGMTFWKPQAHPTDARQTGWEFAAHANAPTPALALVLAALKAHAAKETTNG